jgi:multidrug resistance protein MdtO
MQAPIELPARDALSRLLRRELAVNDTRFRAIIRITGCTVVAVVIAMVFQVPLPAYVAYLVFMVSREDVASTLVTAVGGLVAVTFAVAMSLLFYVFDAAEPALRIPLLAVSTLIGTFIARASPLGPIAFLAGFVLVLSQTLLDDVPTTEFVTHMVLWLWVVVAIPASITVLANLLTGESPVVLARNRAAQLMEQVADYIENPYSADPSQLRVELLSLNELKNKALLWNKKIKDFAQEDGRLLAIVLEMLQIARYLPSSVTPVSRRSLAHTLRQSKSLFLQRRGVAADTPNKAFEPLPADVGPTYAALRSAANALLDEASGKSPAAVAGNAPAPPKQLPAIERALTNRSHARFAFKVMCAVLASYATYSLLDWPGIRTAVTTCFFIALTTFGESIHKLTLRLSGAVIGGLIAGLCIVFVLPYLTDIGELCLLVAVVSMFCAWISTSSETIAYAGMQIAFAFFLGVMQGYGPADDLTELRDRVVGIFVGNIWITIFFTTLWPVSAVGLAREKWSSALKQLGDLLVTKDETALAPGRAEICKKVCEASELSARALFEWRFLSRKREADLVIPEAPHIEQITASAFVLLRLKENAALLPSDDEADTLTSQRLVALSKGTYPGPLDECLGSTPFTLLSKARERLNEEIDHASRTI